LNAVITHSANVDVVLDHDGSATTTVTVNYSTIPLNKADADNTGGGQGGGQAAPAPDDKVSMAFPSGGFSEGKADAPLVLVEYTDYQCPFCQQFHNTAYAQIKTNYIDTGKVRFVSRDFPLDFHENARRGANAARCAAEQGKFWELRHTMIVNASQLQQDKIASYAASVKMDVAKFQSCIAADKYKAAIDKDLGGVAKMREDFTQAGVTQFGSGWCWLAVKDGKLAVMKTPNGENPLVHGATPVLGCDVWEHSYYIDYRNRRPDYLKAFLDNLVNWDHVEEMFSAATK
jgi:superoxide dismutase